MIVPFLDLHASMEPIREELDAAYQRVMAHGWFVRGPELEAFENEYSAFNRVQATVGCSNGLDGLRLALEVAGIGPGDEVLVPANTYIATVLAVMHVGARPVLVDPHARTGLLDPASLFAHCTPKTRAVLPVHLFGHPVNMTELARVAEELNLLIIEDNAQAQGASWMGQPTGSWGLLNATSFYPGKNLGALGDGGAVTTQSLELADRVRSMGNYGSREKYVNTEIGYNMRLDELQAAFLRVKLRHLHRWNRERKAIAGAYDAAFQSLEHVAILPQQPGAEPVHHVYVIRVANRSRLQKMLDAAGVQHLVHYPIPPHRQKACKSLNYKKGAFPVSEQWATELLSLPLWPGMLESQIQSVIRAVTDFATST